MSVYMTEEEQLEAIKKWWQKHNGLITVLLSIVLLVLAGYKYWGWHQQKVMQEASNAYEHLMVAFSNQDIAGIHAYTNQLIKEHKKTAYADSARLTLAKVLINQEQYKPAKEQLEYVATHSHVPVFKQIAKMRLARILIAEKQFDQALAKLSSIDDSAYSALVNELKGDIFAATGRYNQAVASYREAMSESQVQGIGNLFLEMKTNELAALSKLLKTDNVAPQTA